MLKLSAFHILLLLLIALALYCGATKTNTQPIEPTQQTQQTQRTEQVGAGHMVGRPCGPARRSCTTHRLTRAEEDQLNIVNHLEHNNLDWVLRKPLQKPRKRINCLQENRSTGAPSECHDGFPEWQTECCDKGIRDISNTDSAVADCDKAELRHLSPVPMKTSVKDYYGSTYYYDFRYPREPISIEFMKDPVGYCKRNPGRYPCYVRESRYDLR